MTMQEIFWLIVWPFIMIGIGSLANLFFPSICNAVEEVGEKIEGKVIDICKITADDTDEEDYEGGDNS